MLTGFFPTNLPKNWEIISLNNCYINNHCCSSININLENFIDIGNNIIKYKKIPENLLVSYIINFEGFQKLKNNGFDNLKLYDIFGYNPNVTKECFDSVEKYENFNNKSISSSFVMLLVFIVFFKFLIVYLI